MAEYTIKQLEDALVNADAAGDAEAAVAIASEISRLRNAQKPPTLPAAPTQEPMFMPDESSGEIPDVPEEAKRVMSGVMRELGQGLTLGGAGELVGAYEGAKAKLFEGQDFQPAFTKGMSEFEAKRKDFAKDYPATAFTSEVAGSLPLGIYSGLKMAGTKLLPKVLASGAGGGTYGFLGANGDIDQRITGGMIGGGFGLGIPLAGQAIQPLLGKVADPAKRLIAKGIDLTPGQARGSLTGLTESLLGKTFFGDVVGIGKSQKKAFEQFNVKAIEDVMKPLGYKVDLDEPIADAVNSAKIFADKEFKKAVGESSLPVTGRVIQNVMGLKTPENIKRFRSKYNLREQDFAPFKAEIDDAVMSRIEDSSITGEMMQDAVSQLGARATEKMSGSAADRRIGKALSAYREELLDYIQSKAKNAKKFKQVRDVNRDIRPLIDASKTAGAELFSPAQYRKKLESQFGAKWKDTPQGKALQDYLDVLGTGTAPKDIPYTSQKSFEFAPKFGYTAGAGIIGSMAPYLSGAAASTLPLIYSTGGKGLKAGRAVTGFPGLLSETLGPNIAISGQAGGLLAGE